VRASSRSAAAPIERPIASVAIDSPIAAISASGAPPSVSGVYCFSIRWPSIESPRSGRTTGRRPKASIHSLIASMSPGESIDDASTLTWRWRRRARCVSGTSVPMMASSASAKPLSKQPLKSGVFTGTTATSAYSGCLARNSRTRR